MTGGAGSLEMDLCTACIYKSVLWPDVHLVRMHQPRAMRDRVVVVLAVRLCEAPSEYWGWHPVDKVLP